MFSSLLYMNYLCIQRAHFQLSPYSNYLPLCDVTRINMLKAPYKKVKDLTVKLKESSVLYFFIRTIVGCCTYPYCFVNQP